MLSQKVEVTKSWLVPGLAVMPRKSVKLRLVAASVLRGKAAAAVSMSSVNVVPTLVPVPSDVPVVETRQISEETLRLGEPRGGPTKRPPVVERTKEPPEPEGSATRAAAALVPGAAGGGGGRERRGWRCVLS